MEKFTWKREYEVQTGFKSMRQSGKYYVKSCFWYSSSINDGKNYVKTALDFTVCLIKTCTSRIEVAWGKFNMFLQHIFRKFDNLYKTKKILAAACYLVILVISMLLKSMFKGCIASHFVVSRWLFKVIFWLCKKNS